MKPFIQQLQKLTGLAAVAGLLAVAPATTQAADLTDVNEIVSKSNIAAYYRGDDGRAEVRMTIVDSQGRERIRQFTILRKDRQDGGDQDYFVLFTRPSDVRKTAFLVNKHTSKDDDRWLYLPGLDLVKRIAAGDKRTSFVGSNFFYEDVSGRGTEEDKHSLVKTTDQHYVVKSTPKKPGEVEFAYYELTIDKNSMLPVRIDYYDAAGKNYRRVETLEVQEFQGIPTVVKGRVTDIAGNSFTTTQFRNVEYDVGVPDNIFSERTLRNPPRQWFTFGQ